MALGLSTGLAEGVGVRLHATLWPFLTQSDLPTLLAPLTHLRSLVISAQRIISPIRSFERLLADPGKPRSESEINDIFDALDERDMPSMLPTVLKMFKDHADCEVLRWLSYGLSRDWRRRGKKIESDVAFPVPDEEREKERGLKDRHRVQVQTETQWRKRVGAMEQRWIERSLKQVSRVRPRPRCMSRTACAHRICGFHRRFRNLTLTMAPSAAATLSTVRAFRSPPSYADSTDSLLT